MPIDKLDEAIAAGAEEFPAREEERDRAAEALEVIFKASLSTRDSILLVNETAAPGSLIALFTTALLQGVPEGVDENLITVLQDAIESGQTRSATFLDLAKEVHLVEICLPNLRADFESGRFHRPKDLTFEKVQDVLLAKNAEGLLKAAKLESAQFFEVDEAGNLVLSDGTDEVPAHTLGQNYPTARKEIHAAGLELFKRAAYERFQSGERKYEERTSITWLESGEDPSRALDSEWWNGYVFVEGRNPDDGLINRGARRLARIPLKRISPPPEGTVARATQAGDSTKGE